MALIGTINIAMTASTNALAKGFEQARGIVSSLEAGINRIGGVVQSVMGSTIGTVFMHSAKLAEEFRENVEKLDLVFGETSDTIVEGSNRMAAAFGTSRIAFTSLAQKIGGTLKAKGVGQEAIADMTNNLMILAQAIANFKHISLEEAVGKVQAGLAGRGRGLAEFGIAINSTTKGAAAFNVMMTQGAGLIDQMGERANDRANAFAEFKGRLENIQELFGEKLPAPVESFFAQLNVALVVAQNAWKEWGADIEGWAQISAGSIGYVQQAIGYLANYWQLGMIALKAQLYAITEGLGTMAGTIGVVIDAIDSVYVTLLNVASKVPVAFVDVFNLTLDFIGKFAQGIDSIMHVILAPINDLIHWKVGAEMGSLADLVNKMKLTAPADSGEWKAAQSQASKFLDYWANKLHNDSAKQVEELKKDWAKPWSSEGINAAFDKARKQLAEMRGDLAKTAKTAPMVAVAAKPDKAAKVAKDMFAGAMEVGSKEAASALLYSKYGVSSTKDMAKIAANSDKQTDILQDMQALLSSIKENTNDFDLEGVDF